MGRDPGVTGLLVSVQSSVAGKCFTGLSRPRPAFQAPPR